jgi:hypothetical protein
MKITTIIRKNGARVNIDRDADEIKDKANRLKLTHERLLAALEMKAIDLAAQERKHLASTNVHGDIDMWSQQLVDIRKEIQANGAEVKIAQEIMEEFFT